LQPPRGMRALRFLAFVASVVAWLPSAQADLPVGCGCDIDSDCLPNQPGCSNAGSCDAVLTCTIWDLDGKAACTFCNPCLCVGKGGPDPHCDHLYTALPRPPDGTPCDAGFAAQCGHVCQAGVCAPDAESCGSADLSTATTPPDLLPARDLEEPPDLSTRPPDLSTRPPDLSTRPPDLSTRPPDLSTRPPDLSTASFDLAVPEPPLVRGCDCQVARSHCPPPRLRWLVILLAFVDLFRTLFRRRRRDSA
jgi:hypothetical protein